MIILTFHFNSQLLSGFYNFYTTLDRILVHSLKLHLNSKCFTAQLVFEDMLKDTVSASNIQMPSPNHKVPSCKRNILESDGMHQILNKIISL